VLLLWKLFPNLRAAAAAVASKGKWIFHCMAEITSAQHYSMAMQQASLKANTETPGL